MHLLHSLISLNVSIVTTFGTSHMNVSLRTIDFHLRIFIEHMVACNEERRKKRFLISVTYFYMLKIKTINGVWKVASPDI